MKAYIFDPLWDELTTPELLKKLSDSGIETVIIKEGAPIKECRALFEGDEERLLCLNPDYVSWKLPSEDYKDIPNLKGIMIASTGYEWVDQAYANEHNIPICQIVNFSTEAVAEWAIMIMFNLARQTPRLIKDGFPLDYDKDFMKYRGIELHGKTAGIIGMGNIGRAIADRCNGLGMKVIFWSRSPKEGLYSSVTLERLISEADIIFPITAKNDETIALFTDDLTSSIKPSAIVIDMAHNLINQKKLIEKVENGSLFGYGFEGKPNEFSQHKGNIWAAPAYGWTTDSSMYNSTSKWIDNIVLAAKGQFPHKINVG
jgi:phosphoglycerate dehydrogenase-like enzyme